MNYIYSHQYIKLNNYLQYNVQNLLRYVDYLWKKLIFLSINYIKITFLIYPFI